MKMKRRDCDRCGQTNHLENHHKKHKADGGSDAVPNRRWLCIACHDYQHAVDATRAVIKIEEARLKVLYKRLEIIEQLNTPELCRERGYQSYWEIYKEGIPAFGDKWRCAATSEFTVIKEQVPPVSDF